MIQDIFINAMVIVGVFKITREGMLFSFVREFIENCSLFKYVENPLVNCAICMSSVWGLVYYLIQGVTEINVVLHVLAVAGMVYIISKITSLLVQANTYLDIKQLLEDDNDKQ